jgi:hypothetical protein
MSVCAKNTAKTNAEKGGRVYGNPFRKMKGWYMGTHLEK